MIGRLRLRRRLALSPTARSGAESGRLSRWLAAAGSPEPARTFARTKSAMAVAAAGFGFVWAGAGGAVAGVAGVAAFTVVSLRRGVGARAARIDAAMPSFVASVAAAVRAGASLGVAIAEADVPPALEPAVRACAARMNVGEPVADALEGWGDDCGTEEARLVARAMAIGHRTGGDLPQMLDVLSQIGRERAALAREAHAATAQARMSAWIVAALPAVFLAFTTATSREQAHVVFGTPIGWALLGVGAALETAGIAWMRRMSR